MTREKLRQIDQTRFVTFTGADQAVKYSDLYELSRRYEKIEWGILLSPEHTGRPRFPVRWWVEGLADLTYDVGRRNFNLSAHLCGSYVDSLISGKWTQHHIDLATILQPFKRVQLNFHGEKRTPGQGWEINLLTLARTSDISKEIIFQLDGVNDDLAAAYAYFGGKCSGLFDLSHGAGVLPNSWPMNTGQLAGQSLGSYGYAGGLGPDNIKEQLELIHKAATWSTPIWIDMETKLRTRNDEFDTFDLEKCKRVADLVLR